ncbi:MAG: SDR family oxidoreductase [Phycisphaerae bacterium]|nr:SDR family oxidoreductase [Phycisphaerae bacterium]
MSMPTIQELFDLKGKVALVTGGAGWLGTAFSEALAEARANVVVASRTLAKCQALAERLSNLGQECIALALDVNDQVDVRRVVDESAERFGRLDVLVNNAYSGPAHHSSDETDLDNVTGDDLIASFRGNPLQYFVAAQQAVKHMRKVGGGSIVNVGSMYGLVASYPEAYVGLPVNSPVNYHACKGAVAHMTRHLAAYWAKDNIRVNTLSPGPFPKTEIKENLPEFIARLEKKTPMGRMGLPHELKGLAVLLASQAGSYITGQNILVDGGWTAW